MLELVVPGVEFYDERTNTFLLTDDTTIVMEHSLLSISKWESKYHRSFMNDGPKNEEEIAYYFRCMTINKNVDPCIFSAIRGDLRQQVFEYMNDKMTATTFSDRDDKKRNREIITSEVIYSWMVSLNIPFECEKWHINRLMVLVKKCSLDNAGDNKMSRKDILTQNRILNEARRKSLGTKG